MLTEDMAKMLDVSLIHSRIDYTNSIIRGFTNIKNSVARKSHLFINKISTTILTHLATVGAWDSAVDDENVCAL